MVFTATPFLTPNVTSVGTIDDSEGRQIFATGALDIALKTEGRAIPYLTPGAGIISNVGGTPNASLFGNYQPPVRNGVGYVVAAGAGLALAIVAREYRRCGPGCNETAPGPFVGGWTAIGAGVGALLGFTMDKVHKGTEALFPAAGPSSMQSPNRAPRL